MTNEELNEALNTALYDKMFAEQEKYREWLLTQPPEEILKHTYEYTVREDIVLSLAGVYEPPKNRTDITIPLALSRYLEEHPEINRIVLRLDRDYTGHTAGQALADALSPQYIVITKPPPQGKDYNDYLCLFIGLPIKTKGTDRGTR